ncbi:MAG: hypothetical protein U0793_23700 [Gemmataceae bacterium]
MRSLGRPIREQVVTTRPDLLTTLQASTSPTVNASTTFTQGAANLLSEHAKASNEQLIDEVYRLPVPPPDARGDGDGLDPAGDDATVAEPPTCCGRFSRCRSFSCSGRMNSMAKSANQVCEEYAAKRAKVAIRLLGEDTVVIEGNEQGLRFLGELLLGAGGV